MRKFICLVSILLLATSAGAQDSLRLTRRHDLDWHLHAVSQVRFTADDKALVSTGSDGTIRIWDVATGRARALLDVGSSSGPHLHISPDGRIIGHRTSRTADSRPGDAVLLWNVPAGTRKEHDKLRLLGFFPDNQPLLADYEGRKDIELRLPGAREARLVGHQGDIVTAVLHPGGKLVASGSTDGTIKIWDLATLKATATLEGPISIWNSQRPFRFSSDGGTLFLFSPNTRVVKLWRQEKGTWLPVGKEIQLEQTRSVHTVGPGGAFVIGNDRTSGEDRLVRWDMPAFTQRWSVATVAATNSDVSADGKMVATGTTEGVITLRDADTGKILHTIGDAVPFGTQHSVLFDGSKFLFLTAHESASRRYWLRLVNLADGKTSAFPWKVFPGTLAGSDDGQTLALGQQDGTVHLLERDGKVRAVLKAHEESKSTPSVSNLRFSPDNKMLASSGALGEICLWDVATGDKLATLKSQTGGGYVPTLVFSHDGKTLAASVFNALTLWDVATRKPNRTINYNAKTRPSGLAFTRDDKFLVAGQGELLQILEVNTGKVVREWKGHRGIRCLALSPDDKILATSGNHYEIWLWDPASGKAIGSVDTYYSQCLSLAFTTDGRTLLTTGSRGAILWNVEKIK
jgi:WD40 repeat protein